MILKHELKEYCKNHMNTSGVENMSILKLNKIYNNPNNDDLFPIQKNIKKLNSYNLSLHVNTLYNIENIIIKDFFKNKEIDLLEYLKVLNINMYKLAASKHKDSYKIFLFYFNYFDNKKDFLYKMLKETQISINNFKQILLSNKNELDENIINWLLKYSCNSQKNKIIFLIENGYNILYENNNIIIPYYNYEKKLKAAKLNNLLSKKIYCNNTIKI